MPPMIVGFFDGCCEPTNPNGSMGLGAIVYNCPNATLHTIERIILGDGAECIFRYGFVIHRGEFGFEQTSNNVAEYLACMRIVKFLTKENMQDKPILLCGDSQLVVKQMNGEWGMNGGIYMKYAEQLMDNIKGFTNLDFMWIPREKNTEADTLSKQKMIEHGVEFRIQPLSKTP